VHTHQVLNTIEVLALLHTLLQDDGSLVLQVVQLIEGSLDAVLGLYSSLAYLMITGLDEISLEF
jgi:hypothetical protein